MGDSDFLGNCYLKSLENELHFLASLIPLPLKSHSTKKPTEREALVFSRILTLERALKSTGVGHDRHCFPSSLVLRVLTGFFSL